MTALCAVALVVAEAVDNCQDAYRVAIAEVGLDPVAEAVATGLVAVVA